MEKIDISKQQYQELIQAETILNLIIEVHSKEKPWEIDKIIEFAKNKKTNSCSKCTCKD